MTEIIFCLAGLYEITVGLFNAAEMALPFTTEEFLLAFRTYNQSIFPLQIVFLLMAATIILLLLKKTSVSNLVINIVLVFFWLWMGIAYHLIFFTVINPAAYLFGSLFIAQGLLFFYYGLI